MPPGVGRGHPLARDGLNGSVGASSGPVSAPGGQRARERESEFSGVSSHEGTDPVTAVRGAPASWPVLGPPSNAADSRGPFPFQQL